MKHALTSRIFCRCVISASADRRAEDVRVFAIVVPELEFYDIKRQVLVPDVVECTDHAALDDAPEAFDRLSVGGADNVLPASAVNRRMRVICTKPLIADPLIRAKPANLRRDGLTDEFGEGCGADVLNNARDQITIAADRASNHDLTRADATISATRSAATLIPMQVLAISAVV